LDFKIRELKKEKGPREEEISKMKQQLYNMQVEIDQFLKSNDQIRLNVKEFYLKLRGINNQKLGLDKEIQNRRASFKDM
jgi:hypothetical protein